MNIWISNLDEIKYILIKLNDFSCYLKILFIACVYLKHLSANTIIQLYSIHSIITFLNATFSSKINSANCIIGKINKLPKLFTIFYYKNMGGSIFLHIIFD